MDSQKRTNLKRIAIIDTGSNTVRLAIFDCKKVSDMAHAGNFLRNSEVSDIKFKEIVDVKNTAGLSNYVKKGIFSDAGISKAVRVLKEHLSCAKNLNCDEIYIFATAFLRNAENSSKAILKIEKAIEVNIELLSGDMEATLGLKGARYHTKMDEGLLIDLGGGSCELTQFNKKKCETKSLKMGCVSAFSQYVTSLLPNEKECKKIRESISQKLEDANLKIEKESSVWGIGGSVRAVAKFTREMKSLEKTPKHIRKTDISDLLEFLLKDPSAFAHVAAKSVPDRIHTLVPGSLILSEILKKTKASQIDICKHGLREGYLLSKL